MDECCRNPRRQAWEGASFMVRLNGMINTGLGWWGALVGKKGQGPEWSIKPASRRYMVQFTYLGVQPSGF